ncbi:hypothetical protein [Pseudomonas sp.]|uniref:hypothetical protein n=1 Tax=Pseudomonas sp. TaxID=306 RepID=UPI003D10C09B
MSKANIDRAQAISARASADTCGDKPAALPCGAVLHIGFFFDGFGRNLEEDLRNDRVSNIGRLFLAHPYDQTTPPDDLFRQLQKVYISGLGATFDPALGGGTAVIGAGLKGAISKAQGNLSELPEGTITDAGVEAGKDILTGKNWWERMLNNLKPSKLLSGAVVAIGTAGVEGVAAVRDHPEAAEYFKTGVDTRLEAALQALSDALGKARAASDVPLKRIALSVYGFDFGATLARAFCHKLFDECEPAASNRYQGLELDIVFVGLFDAVDRSMASSIVLDYLLPLVSRVDDGECLPGRVKAALHLVAAHECRSTRRARLIGTSSITPRWEERLVPGISEDVGGGLHKDAAPYSRELHLASLHEMYRAAYRAGVPFHALEQLYEVDADVAGLFELNDHIRGISALKAQTRYMARAGARTPDAQNFLAHRRLYIRRLRSLWQLYSEQSRAFADEEARLERPLLGSESRLGLLLGQGTESMAQASHRDQALQRVKTHHAALRNQLGWLEDVHNEARLLRRGFNPPDVEALLAEWNVVDTPGVTFDIEDLLEFFLNDQYMIKQLSPAPNVRKYFIVRGFDRPDLLKTRGVLPDPLGHVMTSPPR